MNTKIKTTALVCAALFAVTACSSNGESGPDINPSNTITPSKPTTPAKPTTPETPAKPTTPETPAKPTTPETPAKPTTPETLAKPTTPVTPAKPTTPETPAKPTTPVTPAKPTTPVTPTKPTTPTKPANPVTPAKPTTPSQPTPSAAVGGNAMTSTNASYNTAKYVTPQGEMNASVTIDGRKIDLSKANAAFLFYREIGPTKDNMSTRMTVLSGRKYSHVQFGAQTVGIISPTYQTTLHHDSFAIGSITPTSGAGAMPTSGKASYVGDAILLQGGAYTTGASKFDVDFGRKTISGLIDHVYDIPVSGKISGSSFSGEQDGIRMKGNFFGPKAAELGGVFSAEHENNVYQGSFGAKKQ